MDAMDAPYGDDWDLSTDEQRIVNLLTQLQNLSPDTGFAGRVVLLNAEGEFMGDAKLSANAFDQATDSLASLNDYRRDMEEETRPAPPTGPAPLADTQQDVDAVITGFEALLSRPENGGDQ